MDDACKKKLICVSLPLYFNDPNRAIECLGGNTLISSELEKGARFLRLQLRPKDPTSHPLFSEVKDTTNLLLRVRRKKKDIQNDKPNIIAHIYGAIHRTYDFRGLADFQFLPSKPRVDASTSEKELLKNYLLTKETDPMDLTPAILSRIDIPQQYHFRRNTAISKFKSTTESVPNFSNIKVINFFSKESLPSSPHHKKDCVTEVEKEIRQLLVNKFTEKPIWLRSAIIDKLTSKQLRAVKKFLPEIAFTYINGPWRQCWVRYGYDPSIDPNSCMLQIVEIRKRTTKKLGDVVIPSITTEYSNFDLMPARPIRPKYLRNTSNAKEAMKKNSSEDDQYIFGIKLGLFGLFQLEQFKGDAAEIIQNCFRKKVCITTYGWFPYQLFHCIRNLHRLELLRILEPQSTAAIQILAKSVEQLKQDINMIKDKGEDYSEDGGPQETEFEDEEMEDFEEMEENEDIKRDEDSDENTESETDQHLGESKEKEVIAFGKRYPDKVIGERLKGRTWSVELEL